MTSWGIMLEYFFSVRVEPKLLKISNANSQSFPLDGFLVATMIFYG